MIRNNNLTNSNKLVLGKVNSNNSNKNIKKYANQSPTKRKTFEDLSDGSINNILRFLSLIEVSTLSKYRSSYFTDFLDEQLRNFILK